MDDKGFIDKSFFVIDQALFAFEEGRSEKNKKKLRLKLRQMIFTLLEHPEDKNKTLAETIELITSHSNMRIRRYLSVVILRALCTRGALPESTAVNQLHPKIIKLFETSIPDILKRFNVGAKDQTYEKIQKIEQCDSLLREKISILSMKRESVNAFTSARQQIMKTLNDASVSSYFSPYGFKRIKASITEILSQICTLDQTPADEVGHAIDAVMKLVSIESDTCSDGPNTLVCQYYLIFLGNLRKALDQKNKVMCENFQCEVESNFSETHGLEKRYPLHKIGVPIKISVPLINIGPGTIGELTTEFGVTHSDSVHCITNRVQLGTVSPGMFIVSTEFVLNKKFEKLVVDLMVEWRCQGLKEKNVREFSLPLYTQKKDVDWQKLEYSQPYSLDIALGDEFIGRTEAIKRMCARLSGQNMRSFYITGMKRVGKSSLAQALIDNYKKITHKENVEFIYLETGAFACSTANETLIELGKQLSSNLIDFLPKDIKWENPEFHGSLAPLARLLGLLEKNRHEKRFIIILDEFDEIPQELYRYGDLAKTLFLNLRTMSGKKNLAFVLVGGERMVYVMHAQGDKLNRFERESIGAFRQEGEWKEYEDLIRGPTTESIVWCDSAIRRIYEETNGHPYYTKLICSDLFISAVENRDSEITEDEVNTCLSRLMHTLDVNSFMHFWRDGIKGGDDDVEVVSLKRCHVLISYARVARKKQIITENNIEDNLSGHTIVRDEVPALLREFCVRGIMKEHEGGYKITLGLFDKWLSEVGINLLIADRLGEELADAKRMKEDKEYVTSAEIVNLVDKWPPYQGRRKSSEDVRAWLQQVEGVLDQRLLFKLLENILFPREEEIREIFRLAHDHIKRRIPTVIQKSKVERRKDILVTYVDGPGKSGSQFASIYASVNKISTTRVIEMETLQREVEKGSSEINGVVIVDDFVGTGKSMSENFIKYWQKNKEVLEKNRLAILIVVAFGTRDGEEYLRNQLEVIEYGGIDLYIGNTIQKPHYAFSDDSKLWEDELEMHKARELCDNNGAKIAKKTPLGYGDQGLLLVLPMNCPNNSLPILHSEGKGVNGWKPLFPRRKI